MRSERVCVTEVRPGLGVPAGEITIQCKGFRPGLPADARVLLGDTEAAIISASEDRVIVRLPSAPRSLGLVLSVGAELSAVFPFALASPLAGEVHPVSPAIAPDGSIITTVSGSRGQQVAQPLIRITRGGEKTAFSCDITNPTGLAFGPDGQLYVSSRHDGTVYRFRDFEELEPIADDLGTPCGIVFDCKGCLFVGDRAGRILRLDPSWEKEEYARLEPSISASHLAVDALDRLFVTGPTLAMRDPLYVIPEKGRVEIVLEGLARPQGMCFTPEGELLIATAFKGRKGVFRLAPGARSLEHYVAGPMLVGLAAAQEDLFLADNSGVYWLQRRGGSATVI